MTSLYQLKPQFQALLRPLVARLAGAGVTANAVTVLAMLVSCTLGFTLCLIDDRAAFLLLPLWMLLRMAFNAVDGMLAREFGQATPLGAYLNELTDVVSDAALYVPFVTVEPFGWASVASVIFLAGLSELAGALGPMIHAPRSYLGPMGKSDRALVFGALGLWLGVSGSLPQWSFWLMPAVSLLIAFSVVNRVRHGLACASSLSL